MISFLYLSALFSIPICVLSILIGSCNSPMRRACPSRPAPHPPPGALPPQRATQRMPPSCHWWPNSSGPPAAAAAAGWPSPEGTARYDRSGWGVACDASCCRRRRCCWTSPFGRRLRKTRQECTSRVSRLPPARQAGSSKGGRWRGRAGGHDKVWTGGSHRDGSPSYPSANL